MIDISPSDSAGLIGCLFQLFIILGICLNNILAAFSDWETLIIAGGIINIVFSLALITIKDSPISIMLKQFKIKNETKIKQINKKSRCCRICSNSSQYRKWKEKNSILSDSTTLKNVISSMAIFFFQQYSGINAILNNLTEIMKDSRLDLNQNIQSAMPTLVQFLACFVACFLMDLIGPKILWLTSCIGCLISLVIYSYCIYDYKTKNSVPHYVPLVAVFTYCLFFGFGLGPSPWSIFPVLFPDIIRYECNCLIVFSHFIISFIVCYTHPIIENKIGEFYAILIYIAGCFYGFFCIHTLEEEDQEVGSIL